MLFLIITWTAETSGFKDCSTLAYDVHERGVIAGIVLIMTKLGTTLFVLNIMNCSVLHSLLFLLLVEHIYAINSAPLWSDMGSSGYPLRKSFGHQVLSTLIGLPIYELCCWVWLTRAYISKGVLTNDIKLFLSVIRWD